MCCLVSFVFLLDSSCHCSIFVVACQFGIPLPLVLYRFGSEELGSTIKLLFSRISNYVRNLLSLVFWMLMFIFPFILVKHSFMLQVQSLFVIKLGNILTFRKYVCCL
jgi:hypothetical protein